SPLQILRALAVEQPAPPRQLNPECPAALSELVMGLLSKDPAGRPASATAVAEQLERIAERKPAPRRRYAFWLRWGRAAAVLAWLGGLAGAFVLLRPPQEKEKGTGTGASNMDGPRMVADSGAKKDAVISNTDGRSPLVVPPVAPGPARKIDELLA